MDQDKTLALPQRQIIARIPQKGMRGPQWALVVETELTKLWVDLMAPEERQNFLDSGLAKVSSGAFAQLDELIVNQAGTLGWRLGLATLVQFRFSEWDHIPNGPELHRRYGLACARSARILQRKELPPLDPDLWRVKQETVGELRLVLQNMRAQFAVQRKGPTAEDVHKTFLTSIVGSPDFPHLASNAERWRKFLETNPHTLRPMMLGDRTKPAGLYDEFQSWCSGWEQETLRQAISKLKN